MEENLPFATHLTMHLKTLQRHVSLLKRHVCERSDDLVHCATRSNELGFVKLRLFPKVENDFTHTCTFFVLGRRDKSPLTNRFEESQEKMPVFM